VHSGRGATTHVSALVLVEAVRGDDVPPRNKKAIGSRTSLRRPTQLHIDAASGTDTTTTDARQGARPERAANLWYHAEL
jgi:hypothetical protein